MAQSDQEHELDLSINKASWNELFQSNSERKDASLDFSEKISNLIIANKNLKNEYLKLENQLGTVSKSSTSWQKRFDRERKVRKEAENLLEQKALELFNANHRLIDFNESLETKIEERTKELERLNEKLEQRVEKEIKKRYQQEQFLIQQSKMIAMGEMVGSIAHQWRQPLNIIALLMNDLIEAYDYGDLDATYMEKIRQDMLNNINFMSETIDDFRNFFRTSKQQDIFNVAEVVNDVLRLYFHQSKNHNLYIVIKNYLSNQELNVLGFKNEFKQVILNLINNAKDVLVERNIEKKTINIEFLVSENRTFIIVEDNGGGIHESIINKIFEPYFTTKHEGKGTGIGLYMSKTIIETNMGGNLRVENSQFGAKFIIELLRE